MTQVASRDRPLEQGREQSDARNDDDRDKKDKPRGIRKVCINPNLPRLRDCARPMWPNFAVHSIKAHSFQFAVDVLSCHSSLSDGPLMVPSW